MTYPSLLEMTRMARAQLPARTPEFCMSVASIAQEAMEAIDDGSYPTFPIHAYDWGRSDVLRIAADYLQFLRTGVAP